MKLKKSIKSNYASSKNAGSSKVFWGFFWPIFATGKRLILPEEIKLRSQDNKAYSTLLPRDFAVFHTISRSGTESQSLPRRVQWCMFPYWCIDFRKVFWLRQYKYFETCSEDLIFQNLILRTRLCSTGIIHQHGWVVDFHVTNMIRRKCFVPVGH